MYVDLPLTIASFLGLSGTPGVATLTTLIAAPGAGKAIRVSKVTFTAYTDIVGAELLHGRLQASGAVIGVLGASDKQAAFDSVFPFPGLALPANTGLDLSYQSTVASHHITVVVHYYVDDV